MCKLHFLRFSPLLVFCLASFSSKSYANCYFPNGTDVNALLSTDVYQPCNGGDDVSMCCALNRPYPDKCRSDGLCFSTYDLNIWRDSCTDRSWESSSCVKLCDSGTGQYHEGVEINLANFESTVTHCSDGSFCCGNGTIADKCCSDKNGVFILNGETTRNNPNLSSSSSTSSSSSSPSSRPSTSTLTPASHSSSTFSSPIPASLASPTSTHSPAPAASPRATKPTGAIIGSVIGGVAALVLVVGLLLFLRRRATPPETSEATWTDQGKSPLDKVYHEAPADQRGAELDARVWGELDGGRAQHELQ